MEKISAFFLASLREHPQALATVIIKTVPPVDEAVVALEKMGFTVTRTFSLIAAVAASGSAQSVIKLLDKPWVESIEPDAPVHTTP